MKPSDVMGPTSVHLECAVKGCGAAFEVPIVFRLEYDKSRGVATALFARVLVDVDATLELEAPLRAHLDEHATNGAPPVVEPPSWPEVEWCDGGASCEHDPCLAYADEVARDETLAAAEPAGWHP